MARSLGARNPFEGPTFGGFNVGGVQDSEVPPVQSSVATPNPASAGVSGSPIAPAAPVDGAGGSTGGVADASTGFSPTATGFNSGLASLGLSTATSLAGLPGLGTIGGQLGGMAAGLPGSTIGGLAGDAAQNAVVNTGLGAIPNGMVSQDPATLGQQASYTGPTSLLGLIASLVSGNVPHVTTTDPTPFGLANQAEVNLDASPNMGFYSGTGLAPSTFSGLAGDSSTGGRMAGVAPTGEPNTFSTNFGMRGISEGESGTAPTGPPSGIGPGTGTSPTGSGEDGAGPPSGIGPGTGTSPTGEGGDGGGGGGGGVGGGAAGGGASGDGGAKTGGKIVGGRHPIQRPDPKRLSDKLKAGAKVNTGSKKPGQDDVPVRLSRGEFVVDADSTRKYEPALKKMNAEEPRGKGGFNVGGRS